jgi:single-stranded-DNA-specific exonuclease
MGDPCWPAGVVGIAASRVQQELHYAPVIILSIDEAKGVARGSARSVSGFDIHLALSRCADLLVKWGGHKAAAGLTVENGRIEEFARRFEQIAQESPQEIFIPDGKADMELPLSLASTRLLEALRQLEPHGMGNPSPVFALRKAPLTVTKIFGKERNHLKIRFEEGLDGVFWRGAQRYPALLMAKKSRLDVIFQVGWDGFYNRPTLEVKDIGNFF